MSRVGYLINQYPMPSHTFIRNEILELERQGVSVERYALRGWDNPALDATDEAEQARTSYVLAGGGLPLFISAVRLLCLRPGRFAKALFVAFQLSRGSEQSLLKHLVYLLEACQVARWTEQAGVKHLHAHFGTNAAEVALLAFRLGGPSFSFTVHGPEEFDKPLQLKLREKARAASFVVAITSFCRSQLYRWIDLADWSKIEIVHCGLESTFLDAPATAPPRLGRLVCVGRLCEQKAQLLLLDVLKLLQADGLNVHLTLAGDGAMRRDVEHAIQVGGLSSAVFITGWLNSEQVKQAILQADALVMASFAEGLPVVIMESMALGRPVITTAIAGIPELVRDDQEGFLVPAGDRRALADAIKKLLAAESTHLNELAQSCRKRVRERHSIQIEAAKLAKLFTVATQNGARSKF
jgi:glycosyltransferase involved in cell wall biosynthesis